MPIPVQEAPLTIVPVERTREGLLVPTDGYAWPGQDSEIRNRYRQDRLELQEQLGHDEMGINTRRVAGFLSDMGLSMRPYSIASTLNDPKVVRAVARYETQFLADPEGPLASVPVSTYIGKLGLSIIDRRKVAEPVDIETLLCATEAHANGPTVVKAVYNEKGELVEELVAERGFKVQNPDGTWHGHMLERAFSTLLAGAYRQHGTWSGAEGEPYRMYFVGGVHPKYVIGQNMTGNGTIGAMALEVLCESDPEIAPALIEARKSAEGRDRLEELITKISPKLAARMFRRQVGIERVVPDIEGTWLMLHVLRVTGRSPKDVAGICGSGPFSEYVSQCLSTAHAREVAAAPTETGEIADESDITTLLNRITETLGGGDGKP